MLKIAAFERQLTVGGIGGDVVPVPPVLVKVQTRLAPDAVAAALSVSVRPESVAVPSEGRPVQDAAVSV